MKYDKIVKAIFIERPNRFIARVKIDGSEAVESVHVKNTGRCRELLLRGAEVILEDCIEKNPNRKTRYDLIAVKKNKIWVNIDSQAPNKVVKEWLMKQGYDCIKPAAVTSVKSQLYCLLLYRIKSDIFVDCTFRLCCCFLRIFLT